MLNIKYSLHTLKQKWINFMLKLLLEVKILLQMHRQQNEKRKMTTARHAKYHKDLECLKLSQLSAKVKLVYLGFFEF